VIPDTAVILSGGLATRMRPFTEKVPKAMLEVAGRPFIDHQLALLKREGLRRVVLCVGYLGEQLEQHVGRQYDGLQVEYSYDGPDLLGTGGALGQARPLLGELFWVLYGDSYLNFDYEAAARYFEGPAGAGKAGLMTVFNNGNLWDTSNVIFEDGKLVRYDKTNRTPEMRYIDYGAAILSNSALDRFPPDQAYDLSRLYTSLVDDGLMIGYEVTHRFYEIGSLDGLQQTQNYLASLNKENER
jgi:N-acetyl-alpha-D-muramate 1-phosphate uridylyltransferase